MSELGPTRKEITGWTTDSGTFIPDDINDIISLLEPYITAQTCWVKQGHEAIKTMSLKKLV